MEYTVNPKCLYGMERAKNRTQSGVYAVFPKQTRITQQEKAAFAAFSFFLSDSSVFLWEDAQKTASDFYHRAPP